YAAPLCSRPDSAVRDCRLFFFSSRRRHTRFSRDWSSDVCSSDLTDLFDATVDGHGRTAMQPIDHFACVKFDIADAMMGSQQGSHWLQVFFVFKIICYKYCYSFWHD